MQCRAAETEWDKEASTQHTIGISVWGTGGRGEWALRRLESQCPSEVKGSSTRWLRRQCGFQSLS